MKIGNSIRNVRNRFFLRLLNAFFCGTHFFPIKRVLMRLSGTSIGIGTKVVGPIYSTATMQIGRDCWIGRNMTANGNGHIIIGDNCDLAPDVMFLTGSHKIGNTNRRAGDGETFTIQINKGCWIGARATILGNTSIGSGSVIGTGALVNKSIAANVLATGVPARIIGSISFDGQIQLLADKN